MSDWTSGYLADVGYTYGYYGELNPLRIKLAFLNAGLAFPRVGTACELGFGQGLSTSIHAAASTVSWSGTDFNPSQAAFALELNEVAGSGAGIFDDAFADFCDRTDLPDFDYIALHGIWSWISDQNRGVIVDFVRRKLKVGGVLYISYNTMPGWAAAAPLRHLLTQHAATMGAEGTGIVNRIEGALGFFDQLMGANPLYTRANPEVALRFEKLKEQNRHYLAHEYFNKDWQPMYFADMAKWLAPAKLNFACSANYLDYFDAINLTAEQQTLLKEIADPLFQQTVRDYMVNQQFRKDYWVKGSRKLSTLEQAESLLSQKIMLVSYRHDIPLKVTGIVGEINMNEPVYAPILDLLADYRPQTIGQLEQSLREKGVNRVQLLRALMLLVAIGHVAAVQDDAAIAIGQKRTQRLNRHLMIKARSHDDIGYLASPVTGGGYAINRFQQLFLLAQSQGHKTPDAWAVFVWKILVSQGQQLIKGGATLTTPEENMKELTEQATTFNEKLMPIIKALQIN